MTRSAVPSRACPGRRATARAYLYGATVALTMACGAFTIAASPGIPALGTSRIASLTGPDSNDAAAAIRRSSAGGCDAHQGAHPCARADRIEGRGDVQTRLGRTFGRREVAPGDDRGECFGGKAEAAAGRA